MNNIATFFRESKTARFFIPLGIILIIVSIFMFVIDKNNKDYIPTVATITKTELSREATTDQEGNREEAMYYVYIKYTVDGKEYEAELGEMFEQKIGDKIDIVYNPKDPTNISMPASPILNTVLLVGGIASLVGGIISAVNTVKRQKTLKKQEESWNNG
ncbi:MAG: hypothetical protein IJ574_01105 [Bacilli bacterium]|nr:hypothetical protein [Bacilli bacterium]